MTRTVRRTSADTNQSASIATFLSFLWPGLGQLYLGRPRAAAAFALPILAIVLLVIAQIRGGLDVLVVRLFAPSTTALVAVLVLAAAVWRLASMADAFLTARGYDSGTAAQASRLGPTWHQARAKRIFAFLIVLVLVSHGLLLGAALAIGNAGNHLFVGAGGPDATPGASDALPKETPYATPLPQGWINTLLVGADSGLGYDHALTDSMIVVSVQPITQQVAMFSFPRDISRFPMYNGGVYAGKLNSLMTTAAAHPDQYSDGALGTLSRELGFLLGVPMHYYAFINLAGFKTMIDKVGGVDVVNPRAIDDPTYQFPDHVNGFHLSAGPHHLDGRTALAYVRSREGVGDNDFTRARRQQQVLIALREKLVDPKMLPSIPGIMEAAANVVQTNYPVDQAADLLSLSKKIGGDGIQQFVLGPPYAIRPTDQSSTYMLVLQMEKIRALSIRIFGAESSYSPPPSSSPAPTTVP